MRKYGECLFDLLYLICILSIGGAMLLLGNGESVWILFGSMALVLGGGDLFHLVPRMVSLLTGRSSPGLLGFGKWVTSLTATVYYLLLYYVWVLWYGVGNPLLTAVVWVLVVLRVVLCCLPWNNWRGNPSLRWSICRNLPFTLLGLLVACLFFYSSFVGGPEFRFVPLAVLLSFAFYLPVALFGKNRPALGMLMMPKTLMYLWIQWMGLLALLS